MIENQGMLRTRRPGRVAEDTADTGSELESFISTAITRSWKSQIQLLDPPRPSDANQPLTSWDSQLIIVFVLFTVFVFLTTVPN